MRKETFHILKIHANIHELKKLLLLLVSLLLLGCATTSEIALVKSETDSIKNIALITRLAKPDIQVFDLTDRKSKVAVAGVLGGYAVTAITAAIEKRRSVAGDPDEITSELKDALIKAIFEKNIMEVMAQKLNVTLIKENIAIEHGPSPGESKLLDYSFLENHAGFDAFLIMDFAYGLAAYSQGPASAAVNADVMLIKSEGRRQVMNKNIVCDTIYLGGHTVAEYKAFQARLFKEEFAEAVRSLGRVMVVHLTMAPSSVSKPSFWGRPELK